MLGGNVRKRCYFIGSPSGLGAVGLYFEALAGELARRGNDVKLICSQGSAKLPEASDNPAVLTWPSIRPTRLADGIFLLKQLRLFRPDCLIANFGAVNWMCLIGWLRQVPHRVAFYHTLDRQIRQDHADGSSGLKRLLSFRKALVYKTATDLAFYSRAALADARRTYAIPAGKCELWPFFMTDPIGRMKLVSASEREDKIVCAARLDPSKGQDVLLEALQHGGPALSETRIEFLGSGPKLSALRKMAVERKLDHRCTFGGTVPREEVLFRMSRARVTVVPSRYEAFGLTNVESMSVGTPVIASKVDGIPEIIRDGIDGYLVPPEDPAALGAKLAALVSNAHTREKFGRNARERFLAHYEQSAVLAKAADIVGRMFGPLHSVPAYAI